MIGLKITFVREIRRPQFETYLPISFSHLRAHRRLKLLTMIKDSVYVCPSLYFRSAQEIVKVLTIKGFFNMHAGNGSL